MHEKFVVALAIGSIVGSFILDTLITLRRLINIEYGKDYY